MNLTFEDMKKLIKLFAQSLIMMCAFFVFCIMFTLLFGELIG